MDTSVPSRMDGAAKPGCISGAGADGPATPTAAAIPPLGGALQLIVNDLPADLPISHAEQQLVSAYLGDLIRQILLEP
jgi:hypothetical protein